MTLTIEQIYDRYSVRDFARVIEIKRRNEDGVTYEDDWQDVEDLGGLNILAKSSASINYSLSNNSYNFGIVTVGNAKVTLNSKNGQFDDEINSSSVFNGFIRHKSLLRIRDGYVDKYTDPDNPVDVLTTVFEGFIDGTSTSTKVDKDNLNQTLQCVDFLSFLLKEFTVADMGALSSTLLSDLILEILDRSEFTEFFTVSAGNINPGYDISSFDISQYEGQTTLYKLFENFSIGHSFFFVKEGVFFYKEITDGNVIPFVVDQKKLIEFANYDNGIQNVFEKLFWKESSESFTASPNKYNRSKTLNIEGATDTTQRQNLLNIIGGITKIQRKKTKIKIPYFMKIFILDAITIDSPEIIPDDALVWAVNSWGEKRWRKSLKADNISSSDSWIIRDIKHSGFITTLIVEEDI